VRSLIELKDVDYTWAYEVLLKDLGSFEGISQPRIVKKRRADLAKLMFRGLPTMEEYTSSNVARVGWKEQTLVVEFKNGSIYAYWGVDRSVLRDLQLAESTGQFVDQMIKPYYECLKLEMSEG